MRPISAMRDSRKLLLMGSSQSAYREDSDIPSGRAVYKNGKF